MISFSERYKLVYEYYRWLENTSKRYTREIGKKITLEDNPQNVITFLMQRGNLVSDKELNERGKDTYEM